MKKNYKRILYSFILALVITAAVFGIVLSVNGKVSALTLNAENYAGLEATAKYTNMAWCYDDFSGNRGVGQYTGGEAQNFRFTDHISKYMGSTYYYMPGIGEKSTYRNNYRKTCDHIYSEVGINTSSLKSFESVGYEASKESGTTLRRDGKFTISFEMDYNGYPYTTDAVNGNTSRTKISFNSDGTNWNSVTCDYSLWWEEVSSWTIWDGTQTSKQTAVDIGKCAGEIKMSGTFGGTTTRTIDIKQDGSGQFVTDGVSQDEDAYYVLSNWLNRVNYSEVDYRLIPSPSPSKDVVDSYLAALVYDSTWQISLYDAIQYDLGPYLAGNQYISGDLYRFKQFSNGSTDGAGYYFKTDSDIKDGEGLFVTTTDKYTLGANPAELVYSYHGITAPSPTAWSAKNTYNLYLWYLNMLRSVDPAINSALFTICQESRDGLGEYVFKNNSKEWCAINGNVGNYKDWHATIVDEHYKYLKEGKISDVLTWLANESNYSGFSAYGGTDYYNINTQVIDDPDGGQQTIPVTPDPIDPGIIDDGGYEPGEPDPCFAGAGSLGWILCPISSALAETLDHLYEDVVEDFLVVDTRLFTNDDQGAHKAWGIFVNIANVLMVIFLLIIVFSQLTGVGIDNYGIKKALPKIIIGAILINLSYILCQTLVDVSNIVGDSINSLLSGIGDSLTEVPANFYKDGALVGDIEHAGLFKTLIGGTMLTAGAAGALSIYASFMEAGFFGVFVPILIAALGALIAVLFFFIILGIRQVAVVLLVVISPLAFVCYMLPNTKNLFDKWKNLLKTMLLVYPIAGLTVGGGYLATKILMSAGAGGSANAFMMLIYIVTMVYPFFLVPSMISRSMGALGDITSKLSNFGRGLRQRTANGLNRGIQSSARYQAARQEAAERQKYRVGRASDRLARRNENRLNRRAERRAASGRELSASDQARLDRYRRTQADWSTDREAARDRVSDGAFYAGYANQRRSESSSKNKDTRQWADSRYVSARESKANADRQMAYEDAMQWNDGRIAQAAISDNRNKLKERMARAKAGVVTQSQAVLDRQAENQRNLDLANNNLDVTPEITLDYARSLAKGRFDTAQQKMYAEGFKNLTRADSESKLNALLRGDESEAKFKNDTNYLEALVSDLRSKGGSVEVAKAIMNNTSVPTADSTQQEMDYYKTLTSIAATMSDQPIVKQWGKYAQEVMQYSVQDGSGNMQQAIPVSLDDWISNGDNRELYKIDESTNSPVRKNLDSQKQSLVGYLGENPKITAGMDKDQLDLLSTIYGNHPGILKDGRSAIYASLGASTAEERKKSEGIIDTYVANKASDVRAGDLANIPISDFVKMEPEIFARLVYGKADGDMSSVGSNSAMEQMLLDKASKISQAGGNVLASLDPKIRAALESRFGPL